MNILRATLLCLCFAALGRLHGDIASDSLLPVNDALTPAVAYGVERADGQLLVAVAVEGYQRGASDVTVAVGVQADSAVVLDSKQHANRTPGAEANEAVFEFIIPESSLISSPDGWDKLRLAFAVEWAGDGIPFARLKQQYRQLGYRSPHAGLAKDPAQWAPLDLGQFERLMEDRRQQIAFRFDQPMDGKATIVIEAPDGARVRNLISGQPMTAGMHRIVWDGLDDNGQVMPPGEYQWRSISHPGLEPVYQMEFVEAKGSNHGTFQSAANNGELVFLGTSVSEGGYQVIVLQPDGEFVRGFNAPHGVGLSRIEVAADDRYIYAAYDGSKWGTKIDKTKPDWKAGKEIALVRFDIESGGIADFGKRQQWKKIFSYEVGPGSDGARTEEYALRGLAFFEGRLYLANTFDDVVHVIDPASGEIERTFPLENPVALNASENELFAINEGGELLRVDPASGKASLVAKVAGQPVGFCVGPEGTFYVSDQQDQVIRILNTQGKEQGIIGKPGGADHGPYDPLEFHNPDGLTVLDDWLWVTERDRWEPKRYVAVDLVTEEVAREFFGPTNYGAQGAGFDYQDESFWIGQNTLFKLDIENQTSEPLALLGGMGGRRHTFHRQDGRTFIITSGKATYIQELTEDGLLRPLALFSSGHQYAYSENWLPPEAFIEALLRDYPGIGIEPGKRGGIQRIDPGKGYGMLWVDRNGDSTIQSEEIEFATEADSVGGSAWSHDFRDLTLRVPGMVNGESVVVAIEPEGWWPGGAPKYPSLNDAVKNATPTEPFGTPRKSSAVDRFGNLIINTTPMTAISPEGETLWTYPNNWVGVHGSHKAPLPSVGELQGALFFSGMAPLDDESDVFLLNGNHGRAFVMSSDGLYIDEMFPDVRMMTDPFAGGIGILGGECFGGAFGKSEKTGKYYFQGGGIAYRIYEVAGLSETVRDQGELQVTASQVEAAERAKARRVAEESLDKVALIPTTTNAFEIDGRDGEWPETLTAEWSSDGKFPVKVRAAYDDENLYLYYVVEDSSPWVNQGNDWQLLFKTGDGVDLQLGADPGAKANRNDPVPGDIRLFIAPSSNGNQVVLYRHRSPGAAEGDGVVFQSPWRSEKVDIVRRIDSAKVGVQKYSRRYEVEAAIPLAELGLSSINGQALTGDFGVVYGDAEGKVNIFRNYWSNQATGLVNDVPGEIMLNPSLWSSITFESN
ncbi:MAG: FlgD immunoglobulin-like domain containing protein [Puniceicoccales bacterium]